MVSNFYTVLFSPFGLNYETDNNFTFTCKQSLSVWGLDVQKRTKIASAHNVKANSMFDYYCRISNRVEVTYNQRRHIVDHCQNIFKGLWQAICLTSVKGETDIEQVDGTNPLRRSTSDVTFQFISLASEHLLDKILSSSKSYCLITVPPLGGGIPPSTPSSTAAVVHISTA